MRRDSRRSETESSSYASSIVKIGSFDSVAGFFGIYDHLVKPDSVPAAGHVDYHLFREGITPVWEDAKNKNGGKWIIRLRRNDGLASLYWEELLLAIIGEQFGDLTDHICGAVVSIRANEEIISLWNADADDKEATSKIRDIIRRELDLPHFITTEYKRHALSRNHVWHRGQRDRDRDSKQDRDRDRPRLTHAHGQQRSAHSHNASNERDWSTLRSRK